jgi:predicted ABC-type ATPase
MPRVVLLGGINGAGKTTVSRHLLMDVLKIPTFVNADAIARGLNGLNQPVADEWEVYDNTRGQRKWLAIGSCDDEVIDHPDTWSAFLRSSEDA